MMKEKKEIMTGKFLLLKLPEEAKKSRLPDFPPKSGKRQAWEQGSAAVPHAPAPPEAS